MGSSGSPPLRQLPCWLRRVLELSVLVYAGLLLSPIPGGHLLICTSFSESSETSVWQVRDSCVSSRADTTSRESCTGRLSPSWAACKA